MIKLHTDLMALLDWTKRYPRMRALWCGFLSALFLIVAFPPVGVWWMAFFIPVPLMVVACEPVIRLNRAGLYAAMGMLPAWIWTHQWVFSVSKIGAPFLIVYLGAYVWLFVWAGGRINTRFGKAWAVLPLVWVGVEFLRGAVMFTGYPWYFSAHPLIDSPWVVLPGAAGVGGVYLVGFFGAAVGWLGWKIVCGDLVVRRGVWLVGVFLVWAGVGVLGVWDGGDDGERRVVNVGIVQPNVPQDNRMDWTDRQRVLDWLTLRELTLGSAGDSEMTPELIVWPEGFVPGWTFDPISLERERAFGLSWNMNPRYVGDATGLVGMSGAIPATMVVDQLLEMQKALGIPMVVGSVAFENLVIVRNDEDWVFYDNDGMYNSAFVVDGGEISPVWYNKMHLTPFGEVMPVISRWDWLEERVLGLGATGMDFLLSAGEEPVVLDVESASGTIRVATPICFEATVSGVCRDLVFQSGKRRADLLVNMTNDGWFGNSDGARRTHMLLARWRCVELNTPMIRSANTGVSCVIDRRGRVVEDRLTRVDPEDPLSGYLNASVEIGAAGGAGGSFGGVTVYGRVGDVFGWMALIVSGAGFLLSFLVEFWQKRSEPGCKADG